MIKFAKLIIIAGLISLVVPPVFAQTYEEHLKAGYEQYINGKWWFAGA